MACLLNDADVVGALASKPHPTSFFAKQGQTLKDYVEYTLKNGGITLGSVSDV